MNAASTLYRFILLLYGLLITSCSFAQTVVTNEPEIWMTYYNGRNLEHDFKDMKAHGIDAVEVGIWGIEGNSRAKKVLKAARKNNLKLIIGIPEVCEEAFKMENPERAVMMGGAYEGKAIDRFRFAFTPEKYSITIESPVYDSTNCYGNIGRYFMGLIPVKAEVIVKKAEFDGEQHLQIIDALIEPQKEHFWNMEFDLSGVEGDLENVVLAVYWISEGTRDYWIFGDAVSMFSDGFETQLRKEVKTVIDNWKKANNGVFPQEILALRYGDECFHISGHLNSEACSYPMWDFSASAVQQFKKTTNLEYPRGVGWTDMFGREAYAQWMYNFHEAAANSAKLVKIILHEEGLSHLPVFRNITRMNVFDVMNDADGTGLDLLISELDIVHLDPYPVNDKGYDDKVIPRDMSYVEGLARRHKKKIIPWLQAHVYGHLQHPEPEHISKMIRQQKQHNINGIIWLGYGYNNSGNTFPAANPESWEKAGQMHRELKNTLAEKNEADFAVVRPYTVRTSRSPDTMNTDRFLTDMILETAVFEKNLHYDPFEPLSCSALDPKDLAEYPFIIAEIGIVNRQNLEPFVRSGKTCLLLLKNASFNQLLQDWTGIKFMNSLPESRKVLTENYDFVFSLHKQFLLNSSADILMQSVNAPFIWRKDNLIFVSEIPDNKREYFARLLLELPAKSVY